MNDIINNLHFLDKQYNDLEQKYVDLYFNQYIKPTYIKIFQEYKEINSIAFAFAGLIDYKASYIAMPSSQIHPSTLHEFFDRNLNKIFSNTAENIWYNKLIDWLSNIRNITREKLFTKYMVDNITGNHILVSFCNKNSIKDYGNDIFCFIYRDGNSVRFRFVKEIMNIFA